MKFYLTYIDLVKNVQKCTPNTQRNQSDISQCWKNMMHGESNTKLTLAKLMNFTQPVHGNTFIEKRVLKDSLLYPIHFIIKIMRI
jgi:hypothetical protein